MAKSKKTKLRKPRRNGFRSRLPQRVFRTPLADFTLGFGAMIFAAGCAYLPFYIYMNSADFNPPEMALTGGVPNVEDPSTPQELEDRRNALLTQQSEVDATITGSIEPEIVEEEKKISNKSKSKAPVEDEPVLALPEREPATSGRMTLVFAAAGRGLIRDGSELMPVYVGKRLPDGSTVTEISKSSGQWRLLTSNNELIGFDTK